MPTNKVLRGALLLLALIATFPLANLCFSGINSQSDMGVAAGVIGLAVLALLWLTIGFRQVRKLIVNPSQKAVSVLVTLLAAGTLGGCTTINPGHVGIQVDMYGKERGVQNYTIVTGRVSYNPITTKIFEYPTYTQTAVWTHSTTEGRPVNEEITFTTSDQMQVSADISLAYHLVGEKVPAFYVKFRNDDLNGFTHGFMRNLARQMFDDVAGKYKIEQIMGDNAQFLKETREKLQADLTAIGVEIDQFGFIGAPRPPQAVIDSINTKVQAGQIALQKQIEIQQAEAEAKKRVATADGEAKAILTVAEAQAEANRKIAESLTPTLIQYRIQERWDGKLPQYSGGGAIPFIQLPSTGK